MNADRSEPRASARAALAPLISALHQRLQGLSPRTVLPDDLETHVRHVQRDDGLPAKFSQAAVSVGVAVHPASLRDWLHVVREILRKHDAHSVVVQLGSDCPLGQHATDELCSHLSAAGFAPTTTTDDSTLFAADAAVTSVAAAIAETGTIVCPSGPGLARGASLLAPVHVAVVHTSQLIADLYDYFDRLSRAGNLPADINLITGPSKTADIEGILVTGVHGPRHVHVVLVSL
jgi:L-lactate dehydrogenase complex protein LldG